MDKTPLNSAPFEPWAEQKTFCDILIFSREDETRFLLRTLFELWGYQVEDGDLTNETHLMVEKFQPKIIVVDTFLPFEDSLEFVSQIRQNEPYKTTRVALISGFPKQKYLEISLKAGANNFFEKPLDFKSLQDYLESECLKSEQNSLPTIEAL